MEYRKKGMKGLVLALALCVLMNAFSVVPIFGMDEISSAEESAAEESNAEQSAVEEMAVEETAPEEDTDEEILTALSDPVARIGDAEYESLPEALAAAASGDTITMLGDVWAEETLVIDKTITLDLANSIVSAGFRTSEEKPLIKVEGNGILTITGNEANGGSAGTLTTSDGSGYAIVLSGEDAGLYVRGGVVWAGSNAVYIDGGAYAEVDGGYVSSNSKTINFGETIPRSPGSRW